MEKRLESLDLNLLLALHWLLTERNVTAAAAKLGLSQPAASRALGRLRDVFGDPLLVKVGGEMAPTPLAKQIQPQLAHAMERCRDVLRVSGEFVPAQQDGRFRIACSDYVGVLFAAVWEWAVQREAPKMGLDLVTPVLETARDLVTGKVDMCILTDAAALKLPPTIDQDAYVQKPMMEQEYLSAIRKDHALAGKDITLEDYLALEHVMIAPDGGNKDTVDDALTKIGRARNIRYRVQSFLMGVPLVRHTDCVITGPRQMIEMRAEALYCFQPPVSLASDTVYAIWHPNWTHDARHKWVRDRLFDGVGQTMKWVAGQAAPVDQVKAS